MGNSKTCYASERKLILKLRIKIEELMRICVFFKFWIHLINRNFTFRNTIMQINSQHKLLYKILRQQLKFIKIF